MVLNFGQVSRTEGGSRTPSFIALLDLSMERTSAPVLPPARRSAASRSQGAMEAGLLPSNLGKHSHILTLSENSI